MEYLKRINNGFIVAVYKKEIEPEATKTAVASDFMNSSEMTDLNNKKTSLNTASVAVRSKLLEDKKIFYACAQRIDMSIQEMESTIGLDPAAALELLNADEIAGRASILASIATKNAEIIGFRDELKTLSDGLEVKRKELYTTGAVYFPPNADEESIDQAKFDELKTALAGLKFYERLKEDETVFEVPKPEGWTDQQWTDHKTEYA